MNYLAFDTSGTHLTVVVGGKSKYVKEIEECFHSHSVLLMNEIENALSCANLTLEDIDVFACSVGPGSFTGIRIGVATVKAFAYSLNKKVLSVTSFESLAYNVSDKVKKLTLIDAKHDNFYVCGFDGENKVIIEPCFKTKDEIIDLYNGFLLISDTKIDGLETVLGNLAKGFELAVENNLDRATLDEEMIIPLYVKKSQAEEEAKC